MSVPLVELTADHVVGLNRTAIAQAHTWDKNCQQKHLVRNLSGLQGCLGGIFYQLSGKGYLHLPMEKMAGLLLYRIAQGQFFLDGNKRTALLSTVMFLKNNGHGLRVDRNTVNDLMWGFAPSHDDPIKPAKYKEEDSIQYIFDNILPPTNHP